MSAQAFDKLEQQINMLILHCQQLEQSNQDLQQQVSALKEERNQRLHVANQTDQKLEAMISRLKTLEQQA
ncbi:cell division protein ZapB [Amphritea sp.]|uniref:cell division protein ZapB n=1 Tax=Amphritea sp. TaxID=1872502 RepID=UPI003A8F0CEC